MPYRPARRPSSSSPLEGESAFGVVGQLFEAELIADRSWRSRTQLELAVVEYIAWFNNDRLHESLGDVSPVEFEDLHNATQQAA